MNHNRLTPLELLAPAGNHDIGKAAIDHGADALYVGAPKFSARANAGNSMEDIARLIDYAHLYRVRVYLALNTILSDSELPEAQRLIREAYDAGIDGLILQDPGILLLDLPPVPLIASTQMHNDSPEKVKFLEDTGFSRVILARELSLDDIRAIRSRTTVELECFVHGALCVSYSGQCYMSQAVARRSGNRGVCAQPCRLAYTLADGQGKEIIKNKHLLSLKDLNLIGSLDDLVDAGVTSFKIEGRYKDAAYVKNVTAAYRNALDRVIDARPGYCRQSSGRVSVGFTPDLSRTFNRGYTPYFLHAPDSVENQAAMDTPKSMGASVGKVSRIEKKGFFLKSGIVHNGDGMCFISRDGMLQGFRVERVDKGLIIPNTMKGITVGTRIFRNRDHEFLKKLEKASAERRIAVSMIFDQTDTAISLTVTDEDGHRVQVSENADYTPARKPETIRKQIETQLTSTGQTIYTVNDFSINADSPGFLPLSTLNALRREALDQLTHMRKKAYVRQTRAGEAEPSAMYPEKSLDYRANVLNRLSRAFYEKHGAKVLEMGLESGLSPAGKILMTTRYCLRRELGACLKKPGDRHLTEPLRLHHGKHTYTLAFDCAHCRMHVMA